LPSPLTFNPGPSKLSEHTKNDIREALDLGIPEMSHRSAQFTEMSGKTLKGLRTFFGIPEGYRVFYTASATEAMELTIRNLVRRKSAHFTCGRFSELFAEISEANGKETQRISAPWGESPAYDPTAVSADAELITITANETSTGAMCTNADITRIRAGRPDALLAVDITSIAGMNVLQIAEADVWLFSVQKGFGLPSGLGILIVSPRAFERSLELQRSGENRVGTFTFEAMDRLMLRGAQTVCTPNVLDIFLLGRTLARWNRAGGLQEKERQTRAKATLLYEAVQSHPKLRCFVQAPEARSISVACIEAEPRVIAHVHAMAREENLLLGKGYGKLRESTLRLALFPAITEDDVRSVLRLFDRLGT